MKRALIITAMCLAVIAAKAQNATGRIVNESLKPVAYVNVVLLSADSAYINGVTTADDGTFLYLVRPRQLLAEGVVRRI